MPQLPKKPSPCAAFVADSDYLAAIVDSSDDAIVSETLDGIIVSWNGAAERIFGYSAAEAIGRPISILSVQGDGEDMRDILERIRRGERVQLFEARRRRKDGAVIDMSLTVSPIRDPEGRIVGASKIARDITLRKREIAERERLAREVDHRARNALAGVQSLIRLTRASTPEGLMQTVERRVAALVRAQTLLSDNRWSGADLADIVAQELRSAPQAGTLEMRGPLVRCLPDAVQPVTLLLHELTANARTYGALVRPEGQVLLSWERDGRGLLLHWTEQGGAEPPAHAPKAGVGLMLAHAAAGQLGGQLELDWAPAGLRAAVSIGPGWVTADAD